MTIKVFSKKRVNSKTNQPFTSFFTYINDEPHRVRFVKEAKPPFFTPCKINIGGIHKDYFIKSTNGFKEIVVMRYEEVTEDDIEF